MIHEKILPVEDGPAVDDRPRRQRGGASNPLDIYLRDIEAHPLLSPTEEVEHLRRLMDSRDAWLRCFLEHEGALDAVWEDFRSWKRKEISGSALIPGPPRLKPGQKGPEHHMARLWRVFETHVKKHRVRPFRYQYRQKTKKLVDALLYVGLRPKPLQRYCDLAIKKHGDRLGARVALARSRFIDARQPLVERNLRLVLKVAWGYVPGPMTFEELIQEGNVGLLRATESFNGRFSVRFSTYAYLWIRQAVIRALEEKSRMIRLPVHLTHLVRKVNRERDMQQELPSVVHYQNKKYRVPQLLANPSVRGGIVSLDQSRNDDGGLAEVIPDDRTAAPEDGVLGRDLGRLVRGSVANLPDRLRRIIGLRFGIGSRPHTLGEIGEIIGVSSERVRQLQEEALDALRSGPQAGVLSGLVE